MANCYIACVVMLEPEGKHESKPFQLSGASKEDNEQIRGSLLHVAFQSALRRDFRNAGLKCGFLSNPWSECVPRTECPTEFHNCCICMMF